MTHPLIERLSSELGWPHLSEKADLEEFVGQEGEHVLFVPGDPRRNLETADVTGTIVYLASDNSAFVTGQTHMVDGGSWFL